MKRKVFSVSLSRNGTTSFHNYMESFGLKSTHYPRVLYTQMDKLGSERLKAKPKFSMIGNALLRRLIDKENKQDALEVLENFDAFSDLPINLLYKSLAKIYPDAIFILIERDENKWLKSMKWLLDGRGLFPNDHLGKLINFTTYKTISFNQELLLKAYKNHNEDCKEFFKTNPNFHILNLDNGDLNADKISQILDIKKQWKDNNFKKYPSKEKSTFTINIYRFIRWIDFMDVIYILFKLIRKI